MSGGRIRGFKVFSCEDKRRTKGEERMKINIGWFLHRRSMLSPKAEAVVCGSIRRSFAEVNTRANRWANCAGSLGVKRGDRIALLAYNEPEYYDVFFGSGKIGAILTPINPRLAAPEIQKILDDCGARVLLYSEDFEALVEAVRPGLPIRESIFIGERTHSRSKSYETLIAEASPEEPEIAGGNDDTLAILYTSGTTGRPKGAELTHNTFYWGALNLASALGDTGGVFLVSLPLFHIGALSGLAYYVYYGYKGVMLKAFDPGVCLELLEREKITAFNAVPTMLNFLKLESDFERYDWSSVRTILVYAAPAPVELVQAYAISGIQVRQLYGLTEFSTATILDAENALTRVGSCGRPFFHTQVKIVDFFGNDAKDGDIGELVLKGPGMMKGYWNRPEATERSIRKGWLYTGDIGRRDKDGFYYITDRKKDVIVTGGEKVYSAEIESYLLGHPSVADVAVIGVPDSELGEVPKAIVVLKANTNVTAEDILAWCKERMADFKIPRSLVEADSIPRIVTGKTLKRVLRDQFGNQ
jgi:fatty-acyl-CoA synthase